MGNNNERYACKTKSRRMSLQIRDVQYNLTEWGEDDAPLFFYLHGWADTGSTFQFVVDALADEWRIVAPDWRGFGRSSHAGESYWFPDYLADLHCILRHYSSDTPVSLVGHSMGANVASLYAGTMPERVAAVVNLEGFGLKDSEPELAPSRYRDWLEASDNAEGFSRYRDLGSLAQKIYRRHPAMSESMAAFVAGEWAVADGEDVKLRADPRHKLPNPVLYRRAEAEACWSNIAAKCLLISGGSSPFAIRFGAADQLPFPNRETACIPGVGHMLHFEAAAEVATLIERFLKKTL